MTPLPARLWQSPPMRVCLLAWGSRGDVQPFAALGAGLATAGYEVSVAAPKDLTPLVEAAGLQAVDFGIDMSEAIDSGVGRAWLEGASVGPVTEARLMSKVVKEFAPIAAEGLARIVGQTDALISGLLTHDGAVSVSESLDMPHIIGLLAPMAPTRTGYATMYPAIRGRASLANLFASTVMEAGFRRLIRLPGDLGRARMGLPRLSPIRYAKLLRATPALLGVSPRVIPPPPEWAGRVVVPGYWSPPPTDFQPGPELAGFLGSGPPPVYLGFGSMPMTEPERVFQAMTRGLAETGRRGLIGLHGSRWRPDEVPGDVLIVDDTPHDWLFPRCSAVVHHGGAGTTSAAIRAGVGQVVVAHMGDQPYWARRVHELGVAAPPLPRHDFSASTLAQRLRIVGDDALQNRAAELGKTVSAEDGVGEAVGWIRNQWGGV